MPIYKLQWEIHSMLLEKRTSLVTQNLASTYSDYPCLLALKKLPVKSMPAILTSFTHQLIFTEERSYKTYFRLWSLHGNNH